jgi:putrescine transport system substrate-binding protein
MPPFVDIPKPIEEETMNPFRLPTLLIAAALTAGCGKTDAPTPPVASPATQPAVAAEKTAMAPAPPSAPVLDPEKVLNIYNYPDYIPEGMLAAFEKETGIKVNYDTFESMPTLYTKLMAGDSGYDLVVPTVAYSASLIANNRLQAIDRGKVPSHVNLDPVLLGKLTGIDAGNKHFVPWAWGFTTVGIHRQKVDKALGNTPFPANAWDLVFKPEYTRKLKSCGIVFVDSPAEIISLALHHLGKSPFSNSPEDIAQATHLLAQVRPDIRNFAPSMVDEIASGKACAFIAWSGEIHVAAARIKESGTKDTIDVLLPQRGGLLYVDALAITKEAKHVNNAHAFIDFYLRANNSALMTNTMRIPTGNVAALPLVDEPIRNNKAIVLSEQDMANLIPLGAFSMNTLEVVNKRYARFKQGK